MLAEKQTEPGSSGALSVAVLMGGASSEREISLMSGNKVAEALENLGHSACRVDVNPEDLAAITAVSPDVVFVALHGSFGEDGTVQKWMEDEGLVYTGSGPEASRLAMDKPLSKVCFGEAGIATPEYRTVGRGDVAALREALRALGPRVFVKPTHEGSSIGVSMPDCDADCIADVEKLWQRHEAVLIERCIEGREFTVGILAEKALPVIELRLAGKFYDYHAKYEAHETQYLLDFDMPRGLYRELQTAAERAHAALGCRDFSRVDFMVSSDGKPYVLEVNTIPGFTERSCLPMAAAAAGVDFPHLCDGIVTLALARAPAAKN